MISAGSNRKIVAAPFIGDRESVLKTLAYYDIFNYPLTKDEIQQFLGMPVSAERLQDALEQLLSNETIFFHHGFYSLQNNPLLAHRRKQGNARA